MSKPAALHVKQVPVSELHPAPWNANRVSDETLAKVRRSLDEFGIVENLVARPRPEGGYEVISGNHRLGLLTEMGMAKVPVHVLDVDDSKARILAQTLNRTRGQDDAEAYAALLTDVLAEMDMDEVLAFLPESEKTRVPFAFSTPRVAYHSPPRAITAGTVAIVSTLLISVGAA